MSARSFCGLLSCRFFAGFVGCGALVLYLLVCGGLFWSALAKNGVWSFRTGARLVLIVCISRQWYSFVITGSAFSVFWSSSGTTFSGGILW